MSSTNMRPARIGIAVYLQALFTGWQMQLGCALLLFGVFLSFVYRPDAILEEDATFLGVVEEVPGQVLHSEYRWRHRQQREQVYAVHYAFALPDGTMHEGVSYADGGGLAPGMEVTVQFVPGNPDRSRIAGLRSQEYDHIAALLGPLVFLGIGLCLVGSHFFNESLPNLLLLGTGDLAKGAVVEMTAVDSGMAVDGKKLMNTKVTLLVPSRGMEEQKVTSVLTGPPRVWKSESEFHLLFRPKAPEKNLALRQAVGGAEARERQRLFTLASLRHLVLSSVPEVNHGREIDLPHGERRSVIVAVSLLPALALLALVLFLV